MRSTIFTTFLLLLLILISAAAAAAAASSAIQPRHRVRTHRVPTPFIRLSCRSTRYPALCENSLANYATSVRHSPRQLARAALNVSAHHARAASYFVYRLSSRSKSPRSGRPPSAVRDCLETLRDSVDRLSQSTKEMVRMGRYGTLRFNWHISNVQTWVSAALTDQSTCLESLKEDRRSAGVSVEIGKRISVVSRVTSNALALVNRLQGN